MKTLLILALVWFCLAWAKLDDLERKGVLATIRYARQFGVGGTMREFVFFGAKILKIPFKFSGYTSSFSGGGILTAPAFRFRDKTDSLANKLSAKEIFEAHGINAPPTLAVCDPVCRMKTHVHHKGPYIRKAVKGECGHSIKLEDAIQVGETMSEHSLYEPRLNSCADRVTDYRVVTLHDGTVFSVFKKQACGPHARSSSASAGPTQWTDVTLSPDPFLRPALEKLPRMHKVEFPEIFAIGFDVMCHNNQYFVLEGNVGAAHWTYTTEYDERIMQNVKKFKSKLRDFNAWIMSK